MFTRRPNFMRKYVKYRKILRKKINLKRDNLKKEIDNLLFAKQEIKSALKSLDNDKDLIFDKCYRPDVKIYDNKYQPKGVLKRVNANDIPAGNEQISIEDLF